MNQEDDRAGALDKVADAFADAVIAAIKSATIRHTAGLVAPQSGGPSNRDIRMYNRIG